MLSLNNITMRYGARLLFEEVTCSFLEGRRYAITGPEWRRQNNFDEDSGRRSGADNGFGFAAQEARNFAAGSVRI